MCMRVCAARAARCACLLRVLRVLRVLRMLRMLCVLCVRAVLCCRACVRACERASGFVYVTCALSVRVVCVCCMHGVVRRMCNAHCVRVACARLRVYGACATAAIVPST